MAQEQNIPSSPNLIRAARRVNGAKALQLLSWHGGIFTPPIIGIMCHVSTVMKYGQKHSGKMPLSLRMDDSLSCKCIFTISHIDLESNSL